MVVFYVPGLVFGTPFRSRIIAVIIAFIINYAAYFSEIYRGGIESIPVGQYEAGQVLGLTKTQTFFKVVLFQVVKRIAIFYLIFCGVLTLLFNALEKKLNYYRG